MTLLASQIPILYCLMYFQSSRRSVRNQANLLLQALAPQRRWSNLPTIHTGNSKQVFGNQHDNSRSTQERSWVWHREDDPRKMCLGRYFDSSQTRSNRRVVDNNKIKKVDACTTRQREDDMRRSMSERFMSIEELQTLMPMIVAKTGHDGMNQPIRRFKTDGPSFADLKTVNDFHCGICNTEIAYEVMTHIQDLKGVNHTVINFQDAYQFIPAGRCINENSPCGGGGSTRCIQIYRAQWTLVWAAASGTRLVAHDVPSHCQCINVGAPLLSTNTKSHMVKRLSGNDSFDNSSSVQLAPGQVLTKG